MEEFIVMQNSLYLGASGIVLKGGQVVLSDGVSKVRVDGKEVTVPALEGAIKAGWIRPVKEANRTPSVERKTETATKTVTKADGSGERVEMKVLVQEDNEIKTKKPSPTSSKVKEGEEEDPEAKVVSKIKIPSKFGAVEIDGGSKKIIEELERGVEVRRANNREFEPTKASGVKDEDLNIVDEVGGKFLDRETGQVERVKLADRNTSTKEEPEPLNETEIRKLKFEVVSVIYNNKDLKYNPTDPWRSRAKAIISYYRETKDTTFLSLMVSIETTSVKKEVEKGVLNLQK